MQIAGLTIAKNCNKFKYPIAECIEQHKAFFNYHIIGVPFNEQDNDDTIKTIFNVCHNLNLTCEYIDDISEITNINQCSTLKYIFTNLENIPNVILYPLDWPGQNTAWSQESLDKILQQHILDNINWTQNEIDWIVKIDVDEFYSNDDIEFLKEIMEIYLDSDINAIAHNYSQYVGSLRYTVYDPTTYVCHIFKPGKAIFAGNDAMQFKVTEGSVNYIDNIYLFHIGYCKDPDLITTRIKEHLVLNSSMYPNAIKQAKKWKDYKFEFPKHKKGAKLWPIGISDAPNETEYKKADINKLPLVLLKKIEEFNFYVPDVN